jgi:hypothetical protein
MLDASIRTGEGSGHRRDAVAGAGAAGGPMAAQTREQGPVNMSGLSLAAASGLRYYGYYAARLAGGPSHLAEVAGRSNLNWVNISDASGYQTGVRTRVVRGEYRVRVLLLRLGREQLPPIPELRGPLGGRGRQASLALARIQEARWSRA